MVLLIDNFVARELSLSPSVSAKMHLKLWVYWVETNEKKNNSVVCDAMPNSIPNAFIGKMHWSFLSTLSSSDDGDVDGDEDDDDGDVDGDGGKPFTFIVLKRERKENATFALIAING